MRRGFLLLTAAVLLACPAVVQAQFIYTITNNTVTILAYTGTGGAVTIPSTIANLPVTSIGYQAFYWENSWQYNYGDLDVTSVTIPSGVTNIGEEAFAVCEALLSVSIPNSVTSIGYGAFQNCNVLPSVTIPSGVTNIGDYAFYSCPDLTTVFCKGNAPTLGGPNVFSGEASADPTTVYYLQGTTNWGSTYGGCPAVMQAQWYVATNNGTITITDYNGIGGGVTIPSTLNGLPVTSIGEYAFAECETLTSVAIPNTVTNIGAYAFYFCYYLNSVTIPTNVTSIGDFAFYLCGSLATLTIPASVTAIGEYAFYECTSLSGLYFQGSSPSLGSTAFTYDNYLTIYYLPGTTNWGKTFGGCPTVLWNPQTAHDASFGVRTNGFGFNITATNNLTVVIASCTNLVKAAWTSVATLAITNGTSNFSDTNWKNNPACFYRLQMP